MPEGQGAQHAELERFDGAIARRGGSPALAGVFTFLAVIAVAVAAMSSDWREMVVLGALSLLTFGVWSARLYRYLRIGGSIEVGADGLFAGRKLLIPRAEAIYAKVVEHGSRARVSIRRSADDDVEIDVATAEQGGRLVHALRRDPDQRAMVFAVNGPLGVWQWMVLGCALMLVFLSAINTIGHFWPSLKWVNSSIGMLMAPLLIAAADRFSKMTVTVGTDGIFVHERRQFVRFVDIQRTEIRGSWVWIHHHGGALKFAARRAGVEGLGALRWMEELIRAMQAAPSSPQPAPIGARNTPPRDWIRSLRSALDKGASGFRDRTLLPEQLWSALENSRLSATARAAAAIALGPSLDERGTKRLRIAAVAIANPKLRIVLDAAAGSDEDAIEKALTEVEAMEAQASQNEARATRVIP